MAENKFVKANEEIAETVVSGCKKIEDGVVSFSLCAKCPMCGTHNFANKVL